MTFQWTELECYEENGPITGYQYRIYYDHAHYNQGTVKKNINTLTKLKANIQNFSVAAINKVGVGPHCPPVPVPSFDQGGLILKRLVHFVIHVFIHISSTHM